MQCGALTGRHAGEECPSARFDRASEIAVSQAGLAIHRARNPGPEWLLSTRPPARCRCARDGLARKVRDDATQQRGNRSSACRRAHQPRSRFGIRWRSRSEFINHSRGSAPRAEVPKNGRIRQKCYER